MRPLLREGGPISYEARLSVFFRNERNGVAGAGARRRVVECAKRNTLKGFTGSYPKAKETPGLDCLVCGIFAR